MNSTQLGVYAITSLAPSDFIVDLVGVANEVSQTYGLGDIVDPNRLEEWDQLNGAGIQPIFFTRPNQDTMNWACKGHVSDTSAVYWVNAELWSTTERGIASRTSNNSTLHAEC